MVKKSLPFVIKEYSKIIAVCDSHHSQYRDDWDGNEKCSWVLAWWDKGETNVNTYIEWSFVNEDNNWKLEKAKNLVNLLNDLWMMGQIKITILK